MTTTNTGQTTSDYDRLIFCLQHGLQAGGDDLAYDLQELLLDAVSAVRRSYLEVDTDTDADLNAAAIALAGVANRILVAARLSLRPEEFGID